MSTRSYRGNRGKNVYEIANFSKGVNATNAAMPPGYLKELVNMDISPDGLSLRPREPYLNYALYLESQKEFVSFSNQVGMFISKQFPNWEFIIDFFGKREGYKKVIKDYRIIDGDTFVDNETGIRYRLLIVDAYELGTAEGDLAKNRLESITNGDPITVRYDSQAPSWVDKYNRHLVWAETKGGLNIQRDLIVNAHAKYLDLRVTEHEDDILSEVFEDLEDYEGNTLDVYDYPGGIPVVYRRDINQPPVTINGRPSYILHEFNNIFMGDMLNDLEIGYSFVPSIKINKVNSEFGRYRTEYNPLEQNKMPNHDGIVSLANVIGRKIVVVTSQNELNNEISIIEQSIVSEMISVENTLQTSEYSVIRLKVSSNLDNQISIIEQIISSEAISINNDLQTNEYSVIGFGVDSSLSSEISIVEQRIVHEMINVNNDLQTNEYSVIVFGVDSSLDNQISIVEQNIISEIISVINNIATDTEVVRIMTTDTSVDSSLDNQISIVEQNIISEIISVNNNLLVINNIHKPEKHAFGLSSSIGVIEQSIVSEMINVNNFIINIPSNVTSPTQTEQPTINSATCYRDSYDNTTSLYISITNNDAREVTIYRSNTSDVVGIIPGGSTRTFYYYGLHDLPGAWSATITAQAGEAIRSNLTTKSGSLSSCQVI